MSTVVGTVASAARAESGRRDRLLLLLLTPVMIPVIPAARGSDAEEVAARARSDLSIVSSTPLRVLLPRGLLLGPHHSEIDARTRHPRVALSPSSASSPRFRRLANETVRKRTR